MTLTAAKAADRLADPFGAASRIPTIQASEAPDVDLGKIVLQGKPLSYEVSQAVTSAELERTIEGASTLTLRVQDPGFHLLLNSPLFMAPDALHAGVMLRLDAGPPTPLPGLAQPASRALWFSLTKIVKTGDELELTFEEREVAWLRLYNAAKRAYRDKMTRAEFVLSLLKEVKQGRIPYYIPELHRTQPETPISTSHDRVSTGAKKDQKDMGIPSDAYLTVKGVKATPEQLRVMDHVLDVGVSKNAPAKVLITSIMVVIDESEAGRTSSNVFQQQTSQGWPGGDVETEAHAFFVKAIEVNRQQPNLSENDLAHAVQRNRDPGVYAPFRTEAKLAVKAYEGGGATFQVDNTRVKRYAFSRGDQGQRETSWDAIQRLADEVAWRAFVVAGRFYFISEDRLFASLPIMRISERSVGVTNIDFEMDSRLGPDEVTLTCEAGRWTAPPGSVVELLELGKATGRWLVHTISRSMTDTEATITLNKPRAALPEPANETEDVTDTSDTAGGGSGSDALDKMYAKAVEIDGKHYPYLWGGGHDANFTPPYDCSGGISTVLHAGGFLDSPRTSGQLESFGDAGEGRYFTIYANAGHVFGKFTRPGHSAEYWGTSRSNPGPGGAGFHPARSTSGFVARHPPGL